MPAPLQITVKRLKKLFTVVVRQDLDAVFLTDGRAVKTVLAIFHIFKDGLFSFRIPADDINEARFIT
jgi:hypothetical protein